MRKTFDGVYCDLCGECEAFSDVVKNSKWSVIRNKEFGNLTHICPQCTMRILTDDAIERINIKGQMDIMNAKRFFDEYKKKYGSE